MNNIAFRTVARLQLALSMLLAASVVWAYTTYRPVMGQFLDATAASIVSTTKVIALVAETVQAQDILLDDTQKLIKSMRQGLTDFPAAALINANLPQRISEQMQRTAGILGRTGTSISALGDNLMFSVPTRVELDGIRPSFVMNRPLENQATTIKQLAIDMKTYAAALQAEAATIAKDGQSLVNNIVDSRNQSIKLLDDSEKVLKDVRTQALPNAVAELRSASEQLVSVSSGISMAGNLPLALLVVGLLLAAWCFLNSLSVLHLYSIQGSK